ncbi:B-box zinc finger protein 21 isoform A [Glycine soja]|uniref:B-box zinc finger protein 21 isoform A n=1 Tax=Glycine soja TaxID=3848 RepID=A0A445H8W7_GLYSO|nr:B-box zinc finger protein 21 isoform A [Glycine soja]
MDGSLIIVVPPLPFDHIYPSQSLPTFYEALATPSFILSSQTFHFKLQVFKLPTHCSYSHPMKIQCDVCNKHEASVFCTADEAALCDGCDHRVHHANKLASKHQRFSLLRPSHKQHPLCDICQERRAFTFCQQDRAILCKECDVSIHSANEHTLKHDRFLLTGVKLAASAMLRSSQTTSDSNSTPSLLNVSHQTTPLPSSTTTTTTNNNNNKVAVEGTGSTSASSISEYLIETLPGWQVEDFLDSYFVPFGFCKNDEVLPRLDADVEGHMGSFSTENMGIWVPQAPPPLVCSSQMDRVIVQSETNIKGSSISRLKDDTFTVPQISPPSNSKRARFLWCINSTP